jgi:pyruvate formate lyase activating enzyme
MEAYLYEPHERLNVRCNLCSHRCLIADGKRGICGVRENRGGTLETLVYGRLIARHIDPIEKKPIFHMLPGSLSYSIAAVGCNFHCSFCQNADISQLPIDHGGAIAGDPCTPERIVEEAVDSGCRSISYTYTEPTVFFEFAHDTARLAHGRGLRNVFVTNGYMTPEALEMIRPHLDAANVDLKAFSDGYYKTQCGARLEPVKRTLKTLKSYGVIVEVTTLVIPGLNDSAVELRSLAEFLVSSLGPETPWHISRFHPTYRLLDRPPTPIKTLQTARDIGIQAGLRYVYTGNVPGDSGEKTVCHQCGGVVVDRWGFSVRTDRITGGCCPDCGAAIYGLFA